MRVSAVVPTWQESEQVAACVGWLLGLGVWEVVVVDADSPDGTAACAAAAGAQVIRSPKGRGTQLQAGASAARGEVVWFVHADARPPADAIAQISAAFADPSVVAGAFRLRTVGTTWWASALRVADVRSRYTRHPYGDQAVFVRRSALIAVGGVPDLPLFEDVELARRLWRCGRIARVPGEVRASGRRFERGIWRAALAMNLLPILYRAGVPAHRLAAWYGAPR